jgi:glycosyltransferase involved in cell wall biosynthesis
VKVAVQQRVRWGKARWERIAQEKAIETIEASGLFDPLWYKAQLTRQELEGVDSLTEHYVTKGSGYGFQPNPLFCPIFYKERYPDVASEGFEPFYHFLHHGISEQRDPHILFSTETYTRQLKKQLDLTVENPLAHFLESGHELGFSPHKLFNPDFYESQKAKEGFRSSNFKTRSSYTNQLVEFLEFGGAFNVSPHPLFHIRYYVGLNEGLDIRKVNPLAHFLRHGYFTRSNPHPLFNSDFYLWMNPDVHQSHQNPLMHYLEHGEVELRNPSPLFCTRFYVERYLKRECAQGSLEHFVTEGWRKCHNPSSWIHMAQAFEHNDPENEDFVVEFFSKAVFERPNSAISPELYFALKEIEKDKTKPLEAYLSLSRRMATSGRVSAGRPEKGLVTGLTYYAPFSVVSGLGEACRGYARAMQHANIVYHTVPTEVPSYQAQIAVRPSYARTDWPIALAYVNADATYPFFNTSQGKSFLKHSYRIGLWVWELPSFQSEWFANFASYDEIWVPSTFCQQSVSAATGMPVHLVPLVVEQQSNVVNNLETRRAFRAKWGIPADKFVFYYVFDASSYIERKNPFALIEAFREAFVNEPGAHLLLKIGYGSANKQFTRQLASLLATLPKGSFTIIEEVLSRAELDALVVASDCCVSPHRSEGFGLTVAEALFFGKPVVATDFGGTTDFLTPDTGYPVAYKLIEIERDIGPYKRGNIWADPLPESLCEGMKAVFSDTEKAVSKAQAGARLVRATLSMEAVSAIIAGVLS